MSLKVPRNSSLQYLDAIIASLLEGASLHLFSNDWTPGDTDALNASDYTECTFDGYTPISLTGWAVAVLDPSNKAETELGMQTFTGGAIGSPENIYGIYVMSSTGNLLYAERDPTGPVSMASNGQTYSYKPRYTGKSEF